MRNLSTYKAIIILIFLIGLFTPLHANHTMTGELAVDVRGFNFKNNFESIEFLDTLALIPDSSRRNTKDRKSTRLNSSHIPLSRMPSSA